VLVADRGEVVFARGYGFADRRKNPNGPTCLFDLGGLSQQLTRLLALQLVDAGKLRLDDPVGKFCKDWPADKAAMRVGQLLEHRSGLPAEADWGGGRAAASRSAFAAIAATTLRSPPGQEVNYSALNNNLLALVCEEAGGMRFDKLLQERALRPFGMSRAGTVAGRFDNRLLTARRSAADETGEPATAFVWNWAHRGARGVLASVLDVHELLRRVTDGKTLDATALARWLAPVDGGGRCSVATLDRGSSRLWRFVGDAAGYRARWIVAPDTRTWIVISSDDITALDDLEAGLVALLAAEVGERAPAQRTAPAAPATRSAVTSADRDRFVGAFELPGGGGVLRIERDGDGLRLCGVGLQASARLLHGNWPPPDEARLRKAEDRGLAILERALADDAGIDRQGFAGSDAGAAARALLRPFAGGKLSLVGTRTEHGKVVSWFAVVAADGEHLLRAPWHDDGRLAACEPAQAHPFVLPLAVVRADVAAAAALSGQALTLTVEGQGRDRVLVFEDGTAGAGGLLDCPENASRGR